MVGKTIRSLSFDAKKNDRASQKAQFQANASAERNFYRALKKVAQYSGHIVDAHTHGAQITDLEKMTKSLNDYAELLGPWATRQSAKLLEKVSKSTKRAYKSNGLKMNVGLKELTDSDVGETAVALLNEQVALIKSIPIEAGLRAQKIAKENFINGHRANPDAQVVAQLKQEMGMSTEVAINRAKLIARTETARANASFVQARASAVGVKGYIWRTTMDGAERESHAEMNGKFVEYTKPPKLSDGTRGHAGTFPNCRCWQDPVLPDL